MTDSIATGIVDWSAHREKGSGVYKVTGYDTISGNPIEFELTGLQLFTLARFLPGVIDRDPRFFADYRATQRART